MLFIVVPALHAGTEKKEPELQERKYSDNEKIVTWLAATVV